MPDSVREIGKEAFHSCEQLATLDLGQGVTNIGSSAFWYCYALGEINIPDSLTGHGTWLFRECNSITNAVYGKGLKTITSDITPESSDANFDTLTIRGNGETVIGDGAFRGTKFQVTKVAHGARFADCRGCVEWL